MHVSVQLIHVVHNANAGDDARVPRHARLYLHQAGSGLHHTITSILSASMPGLSIQMKGARHRQKRNHFMLVIERLGVSPYCLRQVSGLWAAVSALVQAKRDLRQ